MIELSSTLKKGQQHYSIPIIFIASKNNSIQPSIPCFDGLYDHWSMLMENFLRSKEYWSLIEPRIEEPEEGKKLTEAQLKALEARRLKDLNVKNYRFQAIDRPTLQAVPARNLLPKIFGTL